MGEGAIAKHHVNKRISRSRRSARYRPKGARNDEPDEPTNEPKVRPDRPPRPFRPREAALEHHWSVRFPRRGPLGARPGHDTSRGRLGLRCVRHTCTEPAPYTRSRGRAVRSPRDSPRADHLEPLPRRRPGRHLLLRACAGDVVGEYPRYEHDFGRVSAPRGEGASTSVSRI